ncbi:LytTR family DNA-binding domain-containing protein [Sphingobium sp. H39-3-25]|uniref:LytTR family DNA-binding domain-containing protein n=1 Tax=Sphingobium arseniciresistens TaxID=3030834 RepID=UPI0023B9502F|nr:LytTR family DNA-binding domain-containing protein [Sphingobium arseniciresistens]
MAVTTEEVVVTNGGPGGTSGGTLARLVAGLVPIAVIVQVSINAASRLADGRASSDPIGAEEAWGYELTSGISILLLLPLIWHATGRLPPAREGWPCYLALHLVGSLIFSALHIALMLALRFLIWGNRYDAGPIDDLLLYEFRKDAWSYAVIVMAFTLSRRLGASSVVPATRPESRVLVVQDGACRHFVRIDAIRYVRAAGNYVEIVTTGESILHRSTMSMIETELGDAFVRIHRSILLSRSNVLTINSTPSGDFTITTRCGEVLKGSRRYRQALS